MISQIVKKHAPALIKNRATRPQHCSLRPLQRKEVKGYIEVGYPDQRGSRMYQSYMLQRIQLFIKTGQDLIPAPLNEGGFLYTYPVQLWHVSFVSQHGSHLSFDGIL